MKFPPARSLPVAHDDAFERSETMATLYPYLALGGYTEAALQHYAETFGGRVTMLVRFGEAMPNAGDRADAVMHAQFEAPGVAFMATDITDGKEVPPGGRISMALGFETTEELERVWAKLAEGGTVIRPIHDTFYGGRLGMVTDKFGITWMLNWGSPPPR